MPEVELDKPKSGSPQPEVSTHVLSQEETTASLTPLLAFTLVLLFLLIIIAGLVLILS